MDYKAIDKEPCVLCPCLWKLFRMPQISAQVKWKFHDNWKYDPDGRQNLQSTMFPLGEQSYPFGSMSSTAQWGTLCSNSCIEWCMFATAIPVDLLLLVCPPLCFLTPLVRDCPPQHLFFRACNSCHSRRSSEERRNASPTAETIQR